MYFQWLELLLMLDQRMETRDWVSEWDDHEIPTVANYKALSFRRFHLPSFILAKIVCRSERNEQSGPEWHVICMSGVSCSFMGRLGVIRDSLDNAKWYSLLIIYSLISCLYLEFKLNWFILRLNLLRIPFFYLICSQFGQSVQIMLLISYIFRTKHPFD